MRPALALTAALALSAASAGADTRVLGKVGEALCGFGIHSEPSARSHVYYRVRPYEYVVVKHSGYEKWLLVALSNGTYGWAPASEIAILPYTVRQAVRQMPVASSRGAGGVAAYATNFVGTPYRWGGNDLANGIDCSGFVKKMFGAIGVNLPRTAAEQAMVGQPITRLEYLQSGDRLYFWEAKRGKVGHTGIYLGNGYFVHSSSGKHGVATSPLTGNWLKILVAARR
jgi:cell wall-associated NlpC family hydrolase